MPDLKQAIHENDHQRGHRNASVKILIYVDFANPDIIPLENNVQTLLEQSGDDVLVVYRHFPQSIKYPLAYATSQALESAEKQNKFWEMLEQVLSNQEDITDGVLRQFARDIGLDVAQFEDDFSSSTVNQRIDRDIQSGKKSGVQDAPAIFINGTRQQTLSMRFVHELISSGGKVSG